MCKSRPLRQGVLAKRHLLYLAEKRGFPNASLTKNGNEPCGGIESQYAIADEVRSADESVWVSDHISGEANFRVNGHGAPLSFLGHNLK